jgi:branched-chain amino acid transport system permease protein
MFVLSMVIVGGLGSTWEPLIGTGLMMVVVEFAKGMGDARNLILGLALVVFVIVLPKGLAHFGTVLAQRLRGGNRPGT